MRPRRSSIAKCSGNCAESIVRSPRRRAQDAAPRSINAGMGPAAPRVRLHELYRVNESNLALRRSFIGLGPRELAALRAVAPWAREAAPRLAAEICAHQLAHPAVSAFYG